MSININSITTGLVAVAILVGLWIPFPSRDALPALYRPFETQTVFAPNAGRVAEISATAGAEVAAGEQLLRLTSDALEQDHRQALLRAERPARQIQLVSLAESGEPGVAGREQTWRAAQSEVAGLRAELDGLEIVSAEAGRLTWINPELQEGALVAEDTALVTIATARVNRAIAYVDEGTLDSLSDRDSFSFFFRRYPEATYPARVTDVSVTPLEVLSEVELASVNGGELEAVRSDDALKLVTPAYRVVFEVTVPEGVDTGARGHVLVEGRPESIVQALWRETANIFLRELDF